MSNRLTAYRSANPKVLSRLAAVLVAALALHPALARAGQAKSQPNSSQLDPVNPRDFQAFGYDIPRPGGGRDVWRKPNGGEILGGFYGADDEVNDRTGEIRHR